MPPSMAGETLRVTWVGRDLLNALAEANPQGCQRVAGGRSLCPERPPECGVREQAPRLGCQSYTLARLSRLNSRSGTPVGVQAIFYAVIRRSPPHPPPATPGYPLATLRVDQTRMSKPALSSLWRGGGNTRW